MPWRSVFAGIFFNLYVRDLLSAPSIDLCLRLSTEEFRKRTYLAEYAEPAREILVGNSANNTQSTLERDSE